MKRFLILFVLAQLTFAAYAQENTAADALQEINDIKLSGNFIWAEGTSSKSEKEAVENAVAVLSYEIQNKLNKAENKDVSGVVMPTSDQCMKIQTKRGNLYRAFVYVKQGSIVTLQKNEKAVVVEKEYGEASKKGTKKKGKDNEAKERQPQSTVEVIYEPNEFEKQMLGIKKAADIEAFIKQDCVEKYGKYKERPADGEYYLIVYNREGFVPACLKFVNGQITNVASGVEDSFKNYKGCGAYWFIQKK